MNIFRTKGFHTSSRRGNATVFVYVGVILVLICVLAFLSSQGPEEGSQQGSGVSRVVDASEDSDSEGMVDDSAGSLTGDPFNGQGSNTDGTDDSGNSAAVDDSNHLEVLQTLSLPKRLKITESVSLLNWKGEETEIAADTVLLLTGRADAGTLTLKTSKSEVFVGNESRIDGKFAILED